VAHAPSVSAAPNAKVAIRERMSVLPLWLPAGLLVDRVWAQGMT
jgi:hypothetical protein